MAKFMLKIERVNRVCCWIALTLMRATSGSLARCGGGWPPPPLSILALEQILAQKSCFPKSRDQLQLIWPVFRIFFPKIAKKLRKIENGLVEIIFISFHLLFRKVNSFHFKLEILFILCRKPFHFEEILFK